MSRRVTLCDIKLTKDSASGALPKVYTRFYSDGTKDEMHVSFNVTPEQLALKVANDLVESNTITYEHAILKGHIKVLAKWKRAVIHFNRNSLHREKDLDGTPYELDKQESANLSFLRYHGLLVREKNAAAGYWVLTRRGNDFLRGETTIPKYAIVRDNQVIGHEGPHVSVTEVWQDAPFWPRKEELIMQRQPQREAVQGALSL